MNYIRPLDSIRTIAVTLVVIAHWFHLRIAGVLDFGGIGVNVFFVLSGFLITGILLENRRKGEELSQNRLQLVKNFYIRRTLRIFPIYYLTLFIVFFFAAANLTGIHENFGYYFSYTSNFMFFKQNHWDGMLSHLWSLAVEEQFYLLWPWLIIFVNRKYLFNLIVGFFFLGLFSHVLLRIVYPDSQLIHVLTPTCFDAFSLGALLAYIRMAEPEKMKSFMKFLPLIGWISFGIFLTLSLLHFPNNPQRTLIAITSVAIIQFIITKPESLVHRYFLNNKILVGLGKISYGIYLYHNLIPWLLNLIKQKMKAHGIFIPLVNANIPHQYDLAWMYVQRTVLLILISWISWKLIEAPINSLKDRFSYQKK